MKYTLLNNWWSDRFKTLGLWLWVLHSLDASFPSRKHSEQTAVWGIKTETVYLKCLWGIAREWDWMEGRQQRDGRKETDKFRWHQQGRTTWTQKPMGLCLILPKPKAASQRMHNSLKKKKRLLSIQISNNQSLNSECSYLSLRLYIFSNYNSLKETNVNKSLNFCCLFSWAWLHLESSRSFSVSIFFWLPRSFPQHRKGWWWSGNTSIGAPQSSSLFFSF